MKEKITVENRLGDEVFFLCCPDDTHKGGEPMQFIVEDDDEIIDAITIDENGVHYCVSTDIEVCPDNRLFLTREEGEKFIAEYCGEFNALNIKYGDPIYHNGIEDNIESARYSGKQNGIVICTKKGFHFLWKERDSAFSLTAPDKQPTFCYQLKYSYYENRGRYQSSVVGVFLDKDTAISRLAEIKKETSPGEPTVDTDVEYQYRESHGYYYPSHRYEITALLLAEQEGLA